MIAYLKKRRLVCVLLFLVVAVFYFQRTSYPSYGYDTSIFLYNPESMLYSWYTHSRFLLVFLKRLFPFLIHSLPAIHVLTYVHVYLYTILFLYFLQLSPHPAGEAETPDRAFSLPAVRDLFCGIFLISSPFFLEQYYFALQSAEVSFCFVVITLSFLTTWFSLTSAKRMVRILLFLLSIALVFFAVSVYQYFALMYLIGALLCLLKRQQEDVRANLRDILWTAAILLIGIVLYSYVNTRVLAHLGYEKDAYLGNDWTRLPLSTIITRIVTALLVTLRGHLPAFLPSFPFAIFYFVCRFLRAKKKPFWETFYTICLLIAPYLLVFLLGNILLERTAIAFTYVTVYAFFLAFTDARVFPRFFRTILVLFSILQVVVSSLLLQSEHVRFRNDVAIAKDLYQTCGLTADTPVVFRGVEHTEENISICIGGTMGRSFFEWGSKEGQVEEDLLRYFMLLQDCPYVLPNDALIEEAKTMTFESEYPEGAYYQYTPNGCVINLGD